MRLFMVSFLGVLLAACGKDLDPDLTTASSDGGGGEDTFGQGETSAGSDPTSPTTTNSSNTTAMTTSGNPTVVTSEPDPSASSITLTTTTTSDTDDTATTTTTTGPDTTTEPSDCADAPKQPADAECTDPSGCGCASGKCFTVPILGGWCGECLGDADCAPGGCTIPDPINSVGARCNKGEPGGGCESDQVCSDPAFDECGTVLDVPGIITVATCGQCKTNADCSANAPNCSPAYDIAHFTGVLGCVPNKSVPNDFGCNLNENGDLACASGHCGEANVMGILKIGICGECNSNADCGGGTCTDPVVDLDNSQLIGATCI